MMRRILPAVLAVALGVPQGAPAAAPRGECVILLNGLNRTERSMRPLERALADAGYTVVNQGYPSRSAPVAALAERALPAALAQCPGAHRVHFVTHSMGAMLLKSWAAQNRLPKAGRAVMLAPPNGGSEIVDRFGDWRAFRWINGPAGSQLGTEVTALPARLPDLERPTGIIAGTRSLNPIFSSLIDGPDDGKVSLRSAFAGQGQRLALPVTHTWMMRDTGVINATLSFLKSGRFDGT